MKKVVWIVIALSIGIGGIYLFNYLTLTQPVLKTIDSDNRNTGIEFELHYKNYVIPNVLVFNLKDVADDKAIADVFRVLLQTTSVLKEKDFETIELAFKGTSKFKIKGIYFRELGKEYETQNPVYTMRTFPENLLDMNGQSAYSEWTGGLLGVLNKQMEDFNDFNKKWYLESLSKNH
ncbi:MAG: hypothetical protein QQN41_07555 [Nitrosopumilus sp.]